MSAGIVAGHVDDGRPVADGLTGPAAGWPGVHVGVVTDNQDPDGQGRVRVRLPWSPDRDDARAEPWARVATMMAGGGRGTWFVPDPDDEVLVAFEGGDPRSPVVLGALWNGVDDPPERMAEGNPVRSVRTRAGVTITLDDTAGAVSLLLETPGGQRVRLDDAASGVTVEDAQGNAVTTGPDGVAVTATGKASVTAASVSISAGSVSVDAGVSRFSGMVHCDSLLTNSVISLAYTPGAGNVW